jgi:hypothetical protein
VSSPPVNPIERSEPQILARAAGLVRKREALAQNNDAPLTVLFDAIRALPAADQPPAREISFHTRLKPRPSTAPKPNAHRR